MADLNSSQNSMAEIGPLNGDPPMGVSEFEDQHSQPKKAKISQHFDGENVEHRPNSNFGGTSATSAPAIYPCPMCVGYFVSLTDMRNHLEAEHRKYQCEICQKLMSHKRNVDRHRKSVHENQRGFGCPMCPYKSAHKQVCFDTF